MKKQVFILVILAIFVASFIVLNRASAGIPGDPTTWEVGWPDLPNMMSPTNSAWPADQKLTLGYIITYIFTFALLIVGIVALLMLVINAVRYMTSTAVPEAKVNAIGKIRNIGLGVLLLMGAYIFLSTINPELLLFGLEEAEMPGLISAFGSITLYLDLNCVDTATQIDLYADKRLDDNPGWNDQTVSFKITNGLIARICSNIDYTGCEVYMGGDPTGPVDADGNSCFNAGAEGFTPANPLGISSVKGEGTIDSIRLILFEDANCERGSQVFTDAIPCKDAGGQQWTGDSYWLLQDTISSPQKDYETVLCNSRDWNDCSNEIRPGSANTCRNRANIRSVCIYEENSPEICIGAFVINNGTRDFVPYLHTSCKNLTADTDVHVRFVGANCRVTLYEEDCGTAASRMPTGDNWDRRPAAGEWSETYGKAIGGILGF